MFGDVINVCKALNTQPPVNEKQKSETGCGLLCTGLVKFWAGASPESPSCFQLPLVGQGAIENTLAVSDVFRQQLAQLFCIAVRKTMRFTESPEDTVSLLVAWQRVRPPKEKVNQELL